MPKHLRLPKKRTIETNASVLKRIFAFIVDLLIINFTVAAPLRRILSKSIPATGSFMETYTFLMENPSVHSLMLWVSFALAILTLSYFVILEWRLGQTLGKMLVKAYVKSDSKKLTFLQAVVRNLFILPFFPFVILWIVDPLFMLFTRNNQRLCEILSKSKVVEYHEL